MRRLSLVFLFSFFLLSLPASGALIVGDFLNPGDGMLVTDDATGTQWLSPVFSGGQSYNAVVAGWSDLTTTHGFTHASGQMVLDLFSNNFGTLPVGFPGTEAGFDNRVASFLANQFKISASNPPDALGFRKEGKVYYRRRPNDTFLKVVWFALREGVLDVISR